MDALSVQNHEDAMVLLEEHLKLLRRDPWTRDAWIVFFPERMTGHEAGHLADVVRKFNRTAGYLEPRSESHKRKLARLGTNNRVQHDPTYSITIDYMKQSEQNPGYWMDSKMKSAFRTDLRNALVEERIYYYANGISGDIIAAHNYTREERFALNKQKLEEQMSRARIFVMSSAFDVSPDKVHWSGKVDADGRKQSGYHDDLVMILSAAVSLWEKAMSGHLPGFPYERVGMPDVRVQYSEIQNY